MSSHMKTIMYEKLHQNLRGAVHLLGERRQNDPEESHDQLLWGDRTKVYKSGDTVFDVVLVFFCLRGRVV